MANTLVTKRMLAKSSVSLDSQMPIMQMGNRTLEKEFAPGNCVGSTSFVKIQDYGVTRRQLDISSFTDEIHIEAVPLTITPARTKADYTILEQQLNIEDMDWEVTKPFTAGHAFTLQREACDTIHLGATQGVVVSSASPSTLALAAAAVKNVAMSGNRYGMLALPMQAAFCSAMNADFGANQSLGSKIYSDGLIGTYAGVQWAEAHNDIVTTVDVFPAGTMTISTAIDATTTVGTTTAMFTATSAPGAALTIKKGTRFTLGTGAGTHRAVGEMGRTMAEKRHYVVQADTTIPTNANTVPVQIPIGVVHFTGPKKNTSPNANVTTGVAVTNLMEASSSYYAGAVWNKNELLLAAQAMSPLPSTDNKAISGADGSMPLRITFDSDSKKGQCWSIIDNLFGSGIYTGRGVFAILLKIA